MALSITEIPLRYWGIYCVMYVDYVFIYLLIYLPAWRLYVLVQICYANFLRTCACVHLENEVILIIQMIFTATGDLWLK